MRSLFQRLSILFHEPSLHTTIENKDEDWTVAYHCCIRERSASFGAKSQFFDAAPAPNHCDRDRSVFQPLHFDLNASLGLEKLGQARSKLRPNNNNFVLRHRIPRTQKRSQPESDGNEKTFRRRRRWDAVRSEFEKSVLQLKLEVIVYYARFVAKSGHLNPHPYC